MNGILYRLKKSLLVRESPDKNLIQVGVYPPIAFTIESPPLFLNEILEHWSQPWTLLQIRDWACLRFPNVDPSLIAQCIIECVSIGLVVEVAEPHSRLDRHILYFDLCGVAQSDYTIKLSRASVGIIGTGGLGSTAAMLLCAAGVGNLTISDGDSVEESNLTRSILFDESDVGSLKVQRAKARLLERSSSLNIATVEQAIDGPGFIEKYFRDCDILLVSADQPTNVTEWVNEASLVLGIPYLRAGYMEKYGVVGPLVVPGKSACFNCNVLNDDEPCHNWRMLNHGYQAPSYGPLNALIASVAVNDIIRYLLSLTPATADTLLIIDSENYRTTRKMIRRNHQCHCMTRGPKPKGNSKTRHLDSLSSHYGESRKRSSMNALFLDAEVLRLVPRKRQQPLHILDLGCGIGSITIPLALEGHYVTAIDILPGMIQRLRRDLPESAVSRVNIHCADVQNIQLQEQQDCAILNLIIDHITDPVPLLKRVHQCLKGDGKMILTIPHPFKDSGTWDKTPSKEGWTYHALSVDNYFAQGLIDKCREDVNGNVVLSGIQTQKRTLQTYFKMLVDCGFLVEAIYEPFPATDVTSGSYNAQFEKASRIPYFIVFVCVPRFGFQQTLSP